MKGVWWVFLVGVLVACESGKMDKVKVAPKMDSEIVETIDTITYFQFTPDSSTYRSNPKIMVDYAYQLDTLTFVGGYDPIIDCGQFITDDTINGWGDRLYVLNAKEEMIFKGKGVGDYYLFEPHFYKNHTNDKIVIVCQLGFEYLAGGEVFLLENGEMGYLGNLDVSGMDMETGVIDILQIAEMEDELIFTFQSDSVLLNPATGDPEFVSSKGLNYRYQNGRFKLNR
ncbi:MAG: hypothetical protein HWE22_08350 [Flavobacteriales bacterium]|nr:hypothetical protein [Flavobacteriales bacterium]